MTAEVAILNKLAVSLAADSAVTTGYPGKERIFTGANKIFTLSKHAPVGIMLYGHVEHCSIPWEVIIKEFRRKLGTKKYPRLDGYVQHFIEYISDSRFMTEKSQETTVFGAAVSAHSTIAKIISDTGTRFVSKDISDAFVVMDRIVSDFPVLENLESYPLTKFSTEYADVFEALFDTSEDFFLVLPKRNRQKFKELVYASLVRAMPSNFSTGIVIAGFGEEDLFPTLQNVQIDGAISNTCRVIGGNLIDIDRGGSTVFMKAFAQEDVVNTFLNGVDADYQDYVIEMMQSFMEEFLEEVLEEHTSYDEGGKQVVRSMVETNLSKSLEDFRKALIEFCQEEYIDPVQDVLRAAPKDEIANVAEALVSLTALKRKVSGDKETVGGPIDVAVISKGDGFVWIKRKHYFSADLNHHFTRNYFSSGGSDGSKQDTEIGFGDGAVQAAAVRASEPAAED